jgi:preprotein translocase subunit SecB
METKASPLVLEDFYIINSNCNFKQLPTTNNVKKIRSIQAKYPVLIDYDIKKTIDKPEFIIGIKVVINSDHLEGYAIEVEGVGLFSISKKMEEQAIANLIHFSALNICIANLRSYIANMTSYFPLGRFNFHSIDMPSLIAAKQGKKVTNE